MAKSPTKQVAAAVHYRVVADDDEGRRLDNYLLAYYRNVPRTRIYRLLRKGEVRVNKKRVDPSFRLTTGDQVRIPPIRIDESPAKPLPSAALRRFLLERILYEDAGLLILNKPAGIPVHGGSDTSLGVIEALRALPEYPSLELAHRLDKGTSGCLVIAKKRSMLRALHTLFREGNLEKRYLALTAGKWKKDKVLVDLPLKKNLSSSGERIVRVDHAHGKESITEFIVCKRFANATLVEAILHTGRTHQIRVHSKYIGHPIAGDDKYGDQEFNQKMQKKGLDRLFLHAAQIHFTLPEQQAILVHAPLDKELKQCLEAQ